MLRERKITAASIVISILFHIVLLFFLFEHTLSYRLDDVRKDKEKVIRVRIVRGDGESEKPGRDESGKKGFKSGKSTGDGRTSEQRKVKSKTARVRDEEKELEKPDKEPGTVIYEVQEFIQEKTEERPHAERYVKLAEPTKMARHEAAKRKPVFLRSTDRNITVGTEPVQVDTNHDSLEEVLGEEMVGVTEDGVGDSGVDEEGNGEMQGGTAGAGEIGNGKGIDGTGGGRGQTCPDDMVMIPSRGAISSFCIDRYEFPNRSGAEPKAGASFEEAMGLCEEKGKRLCNSDEWIEACRGVGRTVFPYGNEFVSGKCNNSDGSVIAGSGAFRECVSDYHVYDLIGNLWEWVTLNGEPLLKGSSFEEFDQAGCSLQKSENSDFHSEDIGFRCCL